ncbi:MAG: FAD-dependent oxidoreductase [Ardenticatenaceae bacterium]|nr:FAD-dependent oxidoreductase [Ardenticatenaceae bacterium]
MMIATERATSWVTISEPARSTPVVREVDVLVVGGGMSGCSAARAAAQGGARTLLVERYGFLGGTATAAMVGCICGLYTCGPESSQLQLIYGHAQELMDRLEALHAGFKYRHRYQLDHEVLKLVLDEWLLQAGVELLLHTFGVHAIVEDDCIAGVVIENKGGRAAIRASVVIDASGDGDVAARAGAPWEKGDAEGQLQAPTYVFYMSGVDIDRAMSIPESKLKEWMKAARGRGEYNFPRISGSYSPAPKPGTVHVNMTRTPGVDGIDPDSLTAGHLEGRRQIRDFIAFLQRHVPGFENAYLDAIAPQLGVRETRRIMGEYVLTREDVLGAQKFADGVCRSSWPVEDHTIGLDTVRLHLPGDDYYHVPYRSLVPQKIDGLLLAGRCISATHDAMASVRVMGPGLALGQAAGTAAVLALETNTAPRNVSIPTLQERLRSAGALI